MLDDKQRQQNAKRKDSLLTTGFSFLILFPMMYLMLPTVIFLFLGMLPTLVALVVDSSSKSKLKYKWLCIGGLNFAGSLPYLFRLWFSGNNTWDGAVEMFLSGMAFFIIYLTAFIGYLLYRYIPPVVLSFLELSDQRRVVNLREAQVKLIAKWGEEVASGVAVNVSEPSKNKADSSNEAKKK
ncbi:MAG: acyl-CoA synthetase [Alphaproteobacteria bacterium]|nr:acyl-CoA synthetase [Alphaproteobacteria bacterium]MBO4644296.1 acyl-CoA synthetase [Alphaproteobacteria bacterium]